MNEEDIWMWVEEEFSATAGSLSKEDREKLDSIEPGAQKNLINEIHIQGEKQEPDENGIVDLEAAIVKIFER